MSNIDFSELIISKKGVILSDRQVVGNIIGERDDSIVVEKDGASENIYLVPKSKVEAYDGTQLILNVSDSELKKYDINIENSNLGSADIIKPLKGIDFVFVVKHIDGKKYAISFRSHAQDFSVLKIAKVLGGGGHNMAAGCVLEINSPDPVKTIVEMIEKAVSEF